MSLKTVKIANGGLVLNRSSGRLVMVTDTEKARQDVRRILQLDAPAGAGLKDILSEVPFSTAGLSAEVQDAIRTAFDSHVSAQRSAQRQDRSKKEQLSSIRRMYVRPAKFNAGPDGASKTGYALRLDVLTADGEPASFAVTLLTPQG